MMNKNFKDLVNFPLMLAPMVGLSHVALRSLVRKYTPSDAKTIWPTEMLNTRRLILQDLGETPETYRSDNDSSLFPQILGNEERFIKPSIEKLEKWGISGIDINMGCPVQKALKHNYGVSLMGDINYAADVVKMTVRNTNLPVSVKLRAADNGDRDKLLEFTKALESAGASWLCLHPRTALQKRRGSADWGQIKFLKENLSIPIVGNGDIQIAEDVFDMIEQTKCDAVMSGRALAARPWLMWQVGEKLGFSNPEAMIGRSPQNSIEEAYEYGRAIIYFIEEIEKHFEPKLGFKRLHFYLRVSHVWLNFGHALIKRVNKGTNFLEVKNIVQEFFDKDGLDFCEKTELRY